MTTRKIYRVDTGDLPKDQAERFLKDLIKRFKTRLITRKWQNFI